MSREQTVVRAFRAVEDARVSIRTCRDEYQARRLYFTSIIELYKALDGGWTPDES